MPADALIAATDGSYAIPVAAVIIAAAGFGYAILTGRRASVSDYEHMLNERINDLVRQVGEHKEQAQECARQRDALERENVALMRQMVQSRNE